MQLQILTDSQVTWLVHKMILKENLKLIDIVVEVLDARIPKFSRNPIIDELAKNKARIIVLNKYDLADKKYVEKLEKYFRENRIKPSEEGILDFIMKTKNPYIFKVN